jgi:prevent-host-death family protein
LKRKPMIRVIPAAQAKNTFGDVLRRVSEQNETQIVARAGLPVAAIVSIEDFACILKRSKPCHGWKSTSSADGRSNGSWRL